MSSFDWHETEDRQRCHLCQRANPAQPRDETDRRGLTGAIPEAGQKVIDYNADKSAQIVHGYRAARGDRKYKDLLDLLDPTGKG